MIIGKNKIVETGTLNNIKGKQKLKMLGKTFGKAYSNAEKEYQILKKAVSSFREIEYAQFGLYDVKYTLIVSCKSEVQIEGMIDITVKSETTDNPTYHREMDWKYHETPLEEEVKRIRKYLSGVQVEKLEDIASGFYYNKLIPFKTSLDLNQKVLDLWDIPYAVRGIKAVGSLYCGNSQRNPLPQEDIDKIEKVFQSSQDGQNQAFEIAETMGVVWTVIDSSKYSRSWENYLWNLLYNWDAFPF